MRKELERIEASIEELAQMTARGFDSIDKKFDSKFALVFGELSLLRDDVHDLKNRAKTYQEMLMDHEGRLDTLER